MSTKYKESDQIPSDVLADRLDDLATAVTRGHEAVAREFGMRVPAERDHDADLVLSEAARRLRSAMPAGSDHGKRLADAVVLLSLIRRQLDEPSLDAPMSVKDKILIGSDATTTIDEICADIDDFIATTPLPQPPTSEGES